MGTIACMQRSVRPPLSRKERLSWLRLLRCENVGPVTFRHLMERFGNADRAIEELPDLARRGGRRRAIRIPSKAEVERELGRAESLGAEVLALGTQGYPPALAAIDDAPPLVYARGTPQLLERPTVAIVGARNASANGRKLARELARHLASEGMLVVSGLARGIDAAAHTGGLDHATGAVLAGGIDVVYPPEHDGLYEAIVERGVVIAERPPGSEPQARHFPRRNRLISGLALGVVVVEAALRSGSLITARFALEQNREVFAVPGSPADPRAKGCNHLLKEGAHLVESAADVVEILARMARRMPEEPLAPAYDSTAPTAMDLDTDALDAARREVYDLLDYTPATVDEVIRECQFSPAIVTMVLLELELAGRCLRHPGNRVALLREDTADAD